MEDLERTLRNNTLAVPAVSVASGILLSPVLGNGILWGFIFITVAVCFYLLLIHNSKDPLLAFRLRLLHYVWLSLAFIGVGVMFAYMDASYRISIFDNHEAKAITGKVCDISESTSGDNLTVDVEKIEWESGLKEYTHDLSIIVRCKNSDCGSEIGDRIEFSGVIEEIRDNPNSFYSGYKDMMASKGIYYTCRIQDGQIRVIGHSDSFISISRKIRNILEKQIENTHLSKATQNFLITVLLGDRAYLDSDTRKVFADAGVAHILALSGMHMGIIGGVLIFILYPFNFAGRFKTRFIIAAILLWGYAFITGMSPSTVRACVMVSFASIAIVLERKRYAFNALFAASLIILLVSPSTIYDVGFQLSFMCVASLAAFASHMNPFEQRYTPWLYKITSLLSATIVATFGSWIITAYYFKSFPLAFIPANILLLPFLPFYILLAILALSLSMIGIHLQVLNSILDYGFDITKDFLSWIGNGNVCDIDVTTEMVIIWISGMILLALFLNVKRWKPMLYAGIVLLCVSLIMIPIHSQGVPDGSFIIIDSYHYISVNVKDGNAERNLKMDRYCISTMLIGNQRIIAVDCELPEKITSRDCDYLIIAGGYKGDIESVYNAFKPTKVVIHSSVRRKKEDLYLKDMRKLNVDHHSLRHQKALKHYLSDSVN